MNELFQRPNSPTCFLLGTLNSMRLRPPTTSSLITARSTWIVSRRKTSIVCLIVLLARFRQSLFRIHEEILHEWNTQSSVKPWSWLNKIADLFNHLSLSQVFSLSSPIKWKSPCIFYSIFTIAFWCVCDLNWINALLLVWPQIKMNTEATIPCTCLSACSDQTRKIVWEENGREEYCIKKKHKMKTKMINLQFGNHWTIFICRLTRSTTTVHWFRRWFRHLMMML